MSIKPPVAIVFDTFGSVVDWRGSLIADLTAFGQQRGIVADWPALIDAWRAAYHPSMDRVRKGLQPWTKLDGLHRASLDQLVAEFGIKGLYVGVPAQLGAKGVEKIWEIKLTDTENAALQKSASAVKELVEALKL